MAVYYLVDVENGDKLLPTYFATIRDARSGAVFIMKSNNAIQPRTHRIKVPQLAIVTLNAKRGKFERKFQGAVVDLRDPKSFRHLYYRWIPKDDGDWGAVNYNGTVRRA